MGKKFFAPWFVKKFMKNIKIIWLSLFSFLSLLPYKVLAQSQVEQGLRQGGFGSLFGSSRLQSSGSLSQFILEIIRIMLFFAGIIAVVFVIIGGYMYITSQGNEEQAEKGQKTLTNALIGVVVTILSYVIVNVVANLVTRGP